MRITGINMHSVNDGLGNRAVIFVSGCAHQCKGCHNPSTWDHTAGIEFTDERRNGFFKAFGEQKDILDGITLSGGDPLHPLNMLDILKFINEFKELYPDKTIWVYTGYTYEDLIKITNSGELYSYLLGRTHLTSAALKDILNTADVLVDGKYVEDLHTRTTPFVGSTNQRIINLKQSCPHKIELVNIEGGK